MLRRIGNKDKIKNEVIQEFPSDIKCFIDLFAGTGCITFEMIKRFPDLYYFVNDIDNDIINLWKILMNPPLFDKLYELVETTPYSTVIFEEFKTFEPKNNLEKALKFLYLSNFSLFGFGSSLRVFCYNNSKKLLLQNMKDILKVLKFVNVLSCKDFRSFILPVSYPKNRPLQKYGQFVYADPPYLKSKNNYKDSFLEQDLRDLIEKLIKSGLRFAISEFYIEKIEQLSIEYGLTLIGIKERSNYKKKNFEILLKNY